MHEELTEFVDAELFVDGVGDPASEKKLLDALAEVEGVADTKLNDGRVDVRYDPVSINKVQICQRLTAAGFTVKEVETAPSSPIVDAEIDELNQTGQLGN